MTPYGLVGLVFLLVTVVDDSDGALVGLVLRVGGFDSSVTLGLVVELSNNGFVEYSFVGFLLGGDCVLVTSSSGLHVTKPGGNSVDGTLEGFKNVLYFSSDGNFGFSVVNLSVRLGRGLLFGVSVTSLEEIGGGVAIYTPGGSLQQLPK